MRKNGLAVAIGALLVLAAGPRAWADTVVRNDATWERANWFGQNNQSWVGVTWSDQPDASLIAQWQATLSHIALPITGDASVWERGGALSYWYNKTGVAPVATRIRGTFALSASERSAMTSARLVGEFVNAGRIAVNDGMAVWVNDQFVGIVRPDTRDVSLDPVGWTGPVLAIPKELLNRDSNTIDILGMEWNDGGGMGKFALSLELAPPNQPPLAVAVADPSVVNQGETAALEGRHSSDPDGDALSYHWSYQSGPEPDITIHDNGDGTASRPWSRSRLPAPTSRRWPMPVRSRRWKPRV